jgi:uncharacterized membrane protein YbaN (DUF454 family)
MKKIFRNIAGFILILLGIIAGPVPILQGWMFVLTGYICLDFKKKNEYENKVICILNRNVLTKKLADLWLFIKKKNNKILDRKSVV